MLDGVLLYYFDLAGGKAAVDAFRRACIRGVHPSQKIKYSAPAVMLMPYIFARIKAKEPGMRRGLARRGRAAWNACAGTIHRRRAPRRTSSPARKSAGCLRSRECFHPATRLLRTACRASCGSPVGKMFTPPTCLRGCRGSRNAFWRDKPCGSLPYPARRLPGKPP